MSDTPRYPGIRITANGNQLVSYQTEARLAQAGVFYPITPSTEMGELYQQSYAEGRLTVFGEQTMAIETEGEHAAQGGAIAVSVTGMRVVNFTSGQGIAYGIEQYYHAPGKLSTMVLEVAARALTKHALNVHCGHDDIYGALDTGWVMLFAKDAQQAADQALIARKVAEAALNPVMNIQDGFLTSHLERSFFKHEAGLIREFLGAADDTIDCPTEAQRTLFGATRRRIPRVIDLKNPTLIGPVQNQPHYMNGVVARRNNFSESIPGFLEAAYAEFATLTGRKYGFISQHRTEGAETIFVALGSAAENVDAAVDFLRETGHKVGSIHVNVLRPFPSDALVNALVDADRVIVLERTDESLAGDNPLTRDIRAAFSRAVEQGRAGHAGVDAAAVPNIFSGVYGLGSRDFRPEGILGAYGFATGTIARQDGRKASDGERFFVVGVDHPYAVIADEKPSLLPESAIAVRLHSIGGWGMITTGKNLGAMIGELGDDIAKQQDRRDAMGRLEEAIHISANPNYGSEKKGAPTAYFLVVAKERVRVNCDLRHVDVVLCCDPKAFTHMNPLDGLKPGGAFVWESDESPKLAWQRIPKKYRQFITENQIQIYTLPGFAIARKATDRPDLRLRMQGNAFLGAFFGVSTFLADNELSHERFHTVALAQYKKKFGRFGDAVVDSNMTVMISGMERVSPVPYGPLDAPDTSGMLGDAWLPLNGAIKHPRPEGQGVRPPVQERAFFDSEFRAGLGYHQPASALASVGVVASATGATASKAVARRETPLWIAENCTQCMDCITACPDSALPNTVQPIATIISTAIEHYLDPGEQREMMLAAVPTIEAACRTQMLTSVADKTKRPFKDIAREVISGLEGGITEGSKRVLSDLIDTLPLAYSQTKAMFANLEKKTAGAGGLFSIFVSDLCKGCAECVAECGDAALVMAPDSEDINAKVRGNLAFKTLLPDTGLQFLGRFDPANISGARAGVLKNHLLLEEAYNALVCGDGACAGCGEKSVLHAVASITESYMRPLYHKKAARLEGKAARLAETGIETLAALDAANPEGGATLRRAVAQLVLGLGGETDEDTTARLAANPVSDAELVDAIVKTMRQDAFNHRDLQAIDDTLPNGMSVMAMAANTGCNSVYGSTPPNNPHPYPWMNSLFQDGATVGWMFGESFIRTHARRSVIPERLCDVFLDEDSAGLDADDLFDLAHFTDEAMTDLEIHELPKVWVVGGDGALGDIGFQNLSKVVLQNRPNVQVLMLDTQVYSNTGGQNSDSSVMPGGFDMNQFGRATQGKMTEKKSVAEILIAGHGSPFVGQLSMANAPKLYRALLDGLEYRGVAYYQAFTTCMPEHGVGDDTASLQATRIRDGRGMPEFVFNPSLGETYAETLDLRGNPDVASDWGQVKSTVRGGKYTYTVAHWAATEARFRRHLKPAKGDEIPLEELLIRITQTDVVNRRFRKADHRAFVPDFGAYIDVDQGGKLKRLALSRQMVLFCVERRKAWRMLQSKAGVVNLEYKAQKALLTKVDRGKIELSALLADGPALLAAEKARLAAKGR